MEDLEAMIMATIGELDDFLAGHSAGDEIRPGLHHALNALAQHSADAAAVAASQPVWDRSILTDDAAFNSSSAPLLITDPMGFIIKANSMAQTMAETGSEALKGHHVGEFIHADDYDNVADIWVRMQVDPNYDSAIMEFRVLVPRGARWFRGAIRAVRNDDLTVANLIVHLADVHDKYSAEQAHARNSQKFGSLLDSLPDPITRLNYGFEVQFANPAAKAFRNLSENHEWPAVTAEDRDRYLQAFEHSWATGEVSTLEHALHTGDMVRWCETTFVPEVGPSGHTETILVIWRDHTTRRRHEEFLAHQARHDPLTGLPNRAHFAELLERAIARQETSADLGQVTSLAVLFLDLDRFKFVNDSLGHLAGDELLQGVSHRLASAVRPGDVIGRLGGDEFTILAENIQAADARVMADRIQERLKAPFILNGREFIVSASIGIVTSDTPQQASDLMRWADSAMYRAKSLGRDRVMSFEQVFAPDVIDQLDMDQQIRSAVDHDELEVYFQPEVVLSDQRIVGAEALLRWNHPTKGLLGADRFIPVAEDNGTIIPIGAWVLRQACNQVAEWEAQGLLEPDFILRVNLSPRQLSDINLLPLVEKTLVESGIPSSRLCLEITETGLMNDVEEALVVLNELASLGISLAIDDFGTGYSSLSALKRFPINILKIDRSFVSGITTEPRDAAIVRTILTLAETLGLSTTAEGIETTEQFDELSRLKCPRGQGYLFSKPLTATKMSGLLNSGVTVGGIPVRATPTSAD